MIFVHLNHLNLCSGIGKACLVVGDDFMTTEIQLGFNRSVKNYQQL